LDQNKLLEEHVHNPYEPPSELIEYESWWAKLRRLIFGGVALPYDKPLVYYGVLFMLPQQEPSQISAYIPIVSSTDSDYVARATHEACRVFIEWRRDHPQLKTPQEIQQLKVVVVPDYRLKTTIRETIFEIEDLADVEFAAI
jgi:hypothetical protein